MRWISLTGRLGTVLLMIGLALGLVSFIPAAPMGGFSSGGSGSAPPEKYEVLGTTRTLTPQTGLRISINTSREMHFYILNVFEGDLQEWAMSWIRERFPDLDESAVWWASRNVTVLDAFLESHSDTVLWDSNAITDLSKEFFPTTVSNATVIMANPSLETVQFEYEIESITTLAPRERTLLPAQFLVLFGLVLAIPWIFFTRIRKAPSQ